MTLKTIKTLFYAIAIVGATALTSISYFHFRILFSESTDYQQIADNVEMGISIFSKLNVMLFFVLSIIAGKMHYSFEYKKLYWVTGILTSVAFVWQRVIWAEVLFHFKVEHGLWKGEFSVNYFIALLWILFISLMLGVFYKIIRTQKIMKNE